jgi:hypothetical protein
MEGKSYSGGEGARTRLSGLSSVSPRATRFEARDFPPLATFRETDFSGRILSLIGTTSPAATATGGPEWWVSSGRCDWATRRFNSTGMAQRAYRQHEYYFPERDLGGVKGENSLF